VFSYFLILSMPWSALVKICDDSFRGSEPVCIARTIIKDEIDGRKGSVWNDGTFALERPERWRLVQKKLWSCPR
jgi:hypothetical protein